MKKTSVMKKLYNSKIFWIVISLLASLSIWIYITSQETIVYTQTFRGVKVELVGEDILRNSKNMVVTDLSTSTVTIEISGPRRTVSAWSSDDLVAQIDVSKLTQSAYTSLPYTVKYPDGTDTSSLKTVYKTPETVNFMVSALTKKVVPVAGSFEGSVAEGFTAEAPAFEPATITVFGPESYLKNISRAWVEFGSQEISSTYSVETGFTLINDKDEECSTTGLTFSEDTVKATLTILEVKDVPLDIDPHYTAGADASNTKITLTPESIRLAGDSAILNGMNKIVVATIDFGSFDTTYNDTFVIKYSDGLKNLSGVTEVEVKIELLGLETEFFTIPADNISYRELTPGYTAEIKTENLRVKLRGTREELDKINPENIRAVADLSDYGTSEGEYLATVKIYVDGSTNVGALGEYNISVVIRKAEK